MKPTSDMKQKTKEVVELLHWAVETYTDKVTMTCSFGGIGGILLAHLTSVEKLRIDILFMDTEFLFPETYRLKELLVRRWHLRVRTVKPRLTPEEQAATYGPALWDENPDLCCHMRKVEPMKRALARYDCWITGLRRDQGASRRAIDTTEQHRWPGGQSITKLNPLAHWTRKDVWHYITEHDVPYNHLLDDGYRSIGCIQCTSRSTGTNERSGRWAGKGKTECGIHTVTDLKSG